jgi:hypothetical protein
MARSIPAASPAMTRSSNSSSLHILPSDDPREGARWASIGYVDAGSRKLPGPFPKLSQGCPRAFGAGAFRKARQNQGVSRKEPRLSHEAVSIGSGLLDTGTPVASSSVHRERRSAPEAMRIRHAAALAVFGWYLLIPPVFSPMGSNPRSSNDLTAPLNRWDIWGRQFNSEESCSKEKQLLRTEAPRRLEFAREHPDQDPNGNLVAVAQAWQLAECVASDDPRLKP